MFREVRETYPCSSQCEVIASSPFLSWLAVHQPGLCPSLLIYPLHKREKAKIYENSN